MIEPEAGKFYKTRNGGKAHVLGVRIDGGGCYPFVGYVVDGDAPIVWAEDGRYNVDVKGHALDLIEEWVEPIEHTFWVNVYSDCQSVHESRSKANKVAGSDRLACVEVVCTEGQFDD